MAELDLQPAETEELDLQELDLQPAETGAGKFSVQKSTGAHPLTDKLDATNLPDISSRKVMSGGPQTFAQAWGGTPVGEGMPTSLDELDRAEHDLPIGLTALIGGTADTLKSTGTIAKLIGRSMQEPGPFQGNVGKWATKTVGSALEKGGQNTEDYYRGVSAEFPQAEEFRGKNPVDNPELLANPRWLTETVARTIPSLAASIIPAVGGGKAIYYGGKVLQASPKVLSNLVRVGQAVMGGSAGGALEMTGTYEEALRMGKTEEEAVEAAKEMFWVSAALNAFSIDKALGSVSGSLVKRIAQRVGKGTAESTSEWAEGPSEAWILGKDIGEAAKQETAVIPASFLLGMLVPGAAPERSAVRKPHSYNDWSGKIQYVIDRYKTKDTVDTIRKDRDAQFAKDLAAIGELDKTTETRTPEQQAELQRQGLPGVGKQNAQWLASELAETENLAEKETTQAEPLQAIEPTAEAQPTAAETKSTATAEPEILDIEEYVPSEKAIEVSKRLEGEERRLSSNAQSRAEFAKNLEQKYGEEYGQWLAENESRLGEEGTPRSIEAWFHQAKEGQKRPLTIAELQAKEKEGYETAPMPEEVSAEELGNPLSYGEEGKFYAVAAVETPEGVFVSQGHSPLNNVLKEKNGEKGFFVMDKEEAAKLPAEKVSKAPKTGRFLSLSELDEAGADVYTALQKKKSLFQRMLGSERGAVGDLSPAAMFYSQLERTIESPKFPEKTDAYVVKRILENPEKGVKKDEMKWSGIEQFLQEKIDKGEKVTKKGLLEFVRENNIEVKETVLGGSESISPAKRSALEQYIRETNRVNDGLYDGNISLEERNANVREIQDELGLSNEDIKLIDENTDRISAIDNPTRHGHANWNTPGGTNRREIVLTVPSIEPYAASDTTHFGDVVGDKTIIGKSKVKEPVRSPEWIEAKKLADKLADQRDSGLITSSEFNKALNKVFTDRGIEPYEFLSSGEDKLKEHMGGKAIAWARIADFTDSEGKKVLLVDEVQSKRHQEGREKGYNRKLVPAEAAEFDKLMEKYQDGSLEPGTETLRFHQLDEISKGEFVPNAPFSKTWHELVMKRMLRYAAENGYDKVAWTTGEQQAERYGLDKVYDHISVWKADDGKSYDIKGTPKGSGRVESLAGKVPADRLASYIGKDLAKKAIEAQEKNASTPTHFRGIDLKVGGEGMKDFYDPDGKSDQNIAKFMAKYTKKWGGEVGTSKIVTGEALKGSGVRKMESVHSLSITPAMKSEVMYKGQPLYDITSLLDPKVIAHHVKVLQGVGRDMKAAMPHLQELGKSTIAKGAQTYQDFKSTMKELLGDMWKMFETQMVEVWRAVKDFNQKLGNRGGAKVGNKVRVDISANKHTTAAELEEQGFTADEQKVYETLRNEDAEDLSGHLTATGKSNIWHDAKKGIDQTLGIISTRLDNIHPTIHAKTRRFMYDVGKGIAKDSTAVHDFVKGLTGLKAGDRIELSRALLDGDMKTAGALAAKHGLTKELSDSRAVLNDIHRRALESGHNIAYFENYWPRVVKDPKGLLNDLHGEDGWSAIETAIRAKEADGTTLSDIEKAQIADSILRGYGDQLGLGVSHAKSRKFETIPAKYLKYYMPADQSIISYIKSMNNAIETAKFFGKGNYAQKDMALGLELGIITDSDIRKSIGSYVTELKKTLDISADKEQELREILHAVMKPARTGAGIQMYKDLTYLQLLAQFTPAVTQLVDLALAAEQAGYINTARAVGKSLTRKNAIKTSDVGVSHILQEFDGTPGRTSKLLEAGLRWTGFEFADTLGKETLLNGALLKMQQQAKKGDKTLTAYIEKYLGKDSVQQVMSELKAGEKTDNTLFLLYNKLADVQPISRIEVPEGFHTAKNIGKTFYVLKTYQLKLLDVYRRDVFAKINKGDLDGVRKLITMTSALLLLGVATDDLKDWLMGKKTANSVFKDSVTDTLMRLANTDNLLKLAGFSKYAAAKVKSEDYEGALWAQIAPPLGVVPAAFKDIRELARRGKLGQGSRSAMYVPVMGKTYYWWLGRGHSVSKDYVPPKTKAEQMLAEFARDRRRIGGVTDDQLDRYDAVREFKDMYKSGSSLADIVRDAKKRGVVLTSDDKEDIIMSKKTGPIAEKHRREKLTSGVRAQDLLKTWRVMTDEEKKHYKPLVLKRISNSETMTGQAKLAAYKEVFGR